MSAPPIPPDIADITAAPLFGTIWNWALYGVLVVQFYVYCYNFTEDKKFIKLLVYAVFLIETVQTVLNLVDLYYRFASGFGNTQRLIEPGISPFNGPIIGAIVSVTVQYFFAYRVWIFSGKKAWWLCLLICACSAIDGAAAFTGGIYVQVHKSLARGQILKIFALTWLIGNTVTDILITAAMIYYLTSRRSDTAAAYSDHSLSRMVRLTVETNVLTTTTGVVALLLIAIYPNKIWYTCPTAFLGKLYSNTLLVSLNNRVTIRRVPMTIPSPREILPMTRVATDPFSRAHPDVVQVRLDELSRGFKGRRESLVAEYNSQDKVIDIRPTATHS